MSIAGTIAAVALDTGAVALLGWTAWTAYRAQERPSARPFAGLVGLLTVWAALTLGSELPFGSGDGLVAAVVTFGELGAALFVPGVWVVYALGYTGRGTGLTRRRIAMLAGIALPVALSGVALAGFVVDSGPPRPVLEGLIASLLGTLLLYLFGLFLYGTYLVVGHGRRHARVSTLQVAVLLAAVGAPYLFGVVGNGNGVANGVTIGLLVSGGLFAVAVRRYPVLTGFPKANYVARTRVVEALREAVVVLDWDDHVIDANATAGELFDSDPDQLVGRPLRSVADGLEDSDLSTGTTATVTLRTTKGRRQFQYGVSAVDSAGTVDGDEDRNEDETETDSDPVARAVVFRDVTDRLTREQRLTVLNRVLRHNVRNELDVVLAYADRIEDEDLRTGIRDSATDLVELGEKAREAEEVMKTGTESPEPVDLVDVAESVVEQYRDEYSGGEVVLSAPDELTTTSHRTIVQEVLSELVDNALTHTDESSPRVEIAVRATTDAAAEISVADNGPGIPERDRQVLADGAETQLEHASGLGLWFVNWGVTQLGGDLTFDENDPDGSVVTVRLYDSEYGD